MSWSELELQVLRWAEARKIIPNSTPLAQTRKTLEEAGEMLEAAAELRVLNDLLKRDPTLKENIAVRDLLGKARSAFCDAVGDTLVTIINACALADVDATACLAMAYHEIKDRRGEINSDGIFVKAA